VKWLLIVIACAGCKQSSDGPAPSGHEVPAIPAIEIKRGQDACKAYVDKVCGCAETTPAMKQPCSLARALPEAMQVSLDVAASADSMRRDVRQANASVRSITKKCIEATARLPAAGCP
jgi:hypothetical protein